jgi:molybdopterin-binding protein
MSTSIRNRLAGTIEKIVSDKVVSELVIRTAAGDVTSIITTGSVNRMNLKEGDKVFAIIKATEVSIEKDRFLVTQWRVPSVSVNARFSVKNASASSSRILSAAANRSPESLSRGSARARVLSMFPGQHHPVPYGQADRVKASLTRPSDEIERFQRESFPFPCKHDSIAYC